MRSQHWSDWSLLRTQAQVGPFTAPSGGEQHFFYLEARDNSGDVSLGIIQFNVVRPNFSRDLLFVDDTRLAVDVASASGCVMRDPVASTLWPGAAELDTFFFAQGGVPWRCNPGMNSPPGIFKGYSFDTVSTRSSPDGFISLTTLARYRHVVWYVDHLSAFMAGAPTDARGGMTMLRFTASPNGPGTVALYAALGGQLWMMGGGAASATQLSWESNLANPNNVYSSSNGELGPGRFMYEVARWRSEITALRAAEGVKSDQAIGGWPGAPDYSQLPFLLQPKTPATDPRPPGRSSTEFYLNNFDAEFLTQPNIILENSSAGDTVAALDTLYDAAGGSATSPQPVMTLYHGLYGPPTLFSGFPLWFFRRSQAIALSDFVLQQIWHLSRNPQAREPGLATRPADRRPAGALPARAPGSRRIADPQRRWILRPR